MSKAQKLESADEQLLCRAHGDSDRPTILYLPGIHGDWTLFSSFRALAQENFHVIEMTYPRKADWDLRNYARAISNEILERDLNDIWLLAESFGSQIAWELLNPAARLSVNRFSGLILAGGFVRHPFPWLVGLARLGMAVFPHSVWSMLFRIYGSYAIFRHRKAPETRQAVREFVARRTPRDLAAIKRRLELIRLNDPSAIARVVTLPVYLLSGALDPVVPSLPVLRWLRKNCPTLAGERVIWPADHNVLGTEPGESLRQIARWIHAHHSG